MASRKVAQSRSIIRAVIPIQVFKPASSKPAPRPKRARGVVVSFPTSRVISQEDFLEYRLLARDLSKAERLFAAKREEIVALLRSGSPVESGPLTAELRQLKTKSGKTIERLEVRI